MRLFQKDDGRHYNIHWLNRIFAVSSLLLLASTVWLMMDDHDREWKTYQAAFRQREIARLREQLEVPEQPAEIVDKSSAKVEEEEDFWGEEDATKTEAVEEEDDLWADEEDTEASTITEAPALSEEERAAISSRLADLDLKSMSRTNRFAEMVRNLPLLDFASPAMKIEQIVVNRAKEELNFVRVARVDRCTTCHQGLLRPEFADAPQPFATHPKPELYLTSTSPHPLQDFGCTVCHGGQGRGTSFASSAHEPADEAQHAVWRKAYDWERPEDGHASMIAGPYVQAACYSCHADRSTLEGAETLMLGLELMDRAGCAACHAMPNAPPPRKPGPSLKQIATKSTPGWIALWLKNPKSIRAQTWMPSFFPVEYEEADAEIAVLTQFLLARSGTTAPTPAPLQGDPSRGSALLDKTGCLGCHYGPDEPLIEDASPAALRKSRGPRLFGLAEKTSPAWLYAWLKDPVAYNSATAMPNLRLTDQEAADIVAHLMMPQEASVETAFTLPELNAAVQQLAPGYLPNDTAFADRPLEEQVDVLGEAIVRYYGCASCHAIEGLDDAGQVAPDLKGIGVKTAHDFDFASVHDLPHTSAAWITHKLREPRSFQRGEPASPRQQLHMPQFDFTDAERQAITTALLGFKDPAPVAALAETLSPQEDAIETGRRLIREHNCRGCHILEAEGGDIRSTIAKWLVDTGQAERDTADVIAPSFSPPNLIGEGKKVQGAWLFDYFANTAPIRPWLHVRMPTFTLTAEDRNALLAYFCALDEEPFPFVAEVAPEHTGPRYEAGKALFSPDYFDCGNCHIQGDKFPTGQPERWAPNFALSAERLKWAWVRQWLYDPQPLLPGTKMPTYFDPEYFDDAGPEDILQGDEHGQIEALTNYVFTLDTPAPELAEAPLASDPLPTP